MAKKEKKSTKKGNARKGRPVGSRLAYDDTKQSKAKKPAKRARKKGKKGKKSGMETIKLRKAKGAKENENITFKKGGLHKSLKVPASYTFNKTELRKIKRYKVGDSFVFRGNTIKMTEKIKRQLSLGLTMMGWSKH